MKIHHRIFTLIQSTRRKAAAIAGCALVLGGSSASAVIFPQQVNPAEFTFDPNVEPTVGVLCQYKSGKLASIGSGAAVGHPKVMLTCAHALFKNKAWQPAANMRFTARHHSAVVPSPASGVNFRAYYKFKTYASSFVTKGGTAKETLSMDSLAAFSYANVASGNFAGFWGNGAGAVLRSHTTYKKVFGYPWSHTANMFMHRTGWFTIAAEQRHGAFHRFTGVTTYPGNSGGPVFAYYQPTGKWYVAGVQITSDSKTLMGVRALEANGGSMLDLAAQAADH